MLKKTDSCIQYLARAKPIVERLNNHQLNVRYFNKMGQISSPKKEYRTAIGYYERTVAKAKISGLKYQVLSNQRMTGIF